MKQKTLSQIAYDLVLDHAKFDNGMGQYNLHVSDLPDFTQHEFAATIMAREDGYASEATGPDNAAYEKTMLPALLKYLQNSTDRDEEIEFNNAWRDGVTSYMTRKMQELIDDALQEYNSDEGFTYDPASDLPTRTVDREVSIWW